MSSLFAEKVALVTGGSGGIGSETARRLASAGAKVAVHYNHSVDRAAEVVRCIADAGGTAIAVHGDVSDEADSLRIVAETIDSFGALDILVNNAGVSSSYAFGAMSAADVDRELAINVRSVVLMTQAAVPYLERGGRIVNVGSNLAFAPLPTLTLYGASKAAVTSLTAGFAKELGARGISVNAVAPGATETPMTGWIDESTWSGIEEATPLGRRAQPDDIADVILFLASAQSRWINGRTLLVDGGLV